MDKVFLINKPKGWTSFDVVAKIRGALRAKYTGQKIKVGHAGTLDPFATGLLIVLAGAQTKNQDGYMKQDKEYLATLKLGAVSTTLDPEGEITSSSTKVPKLKEVQTVLKKYQGVIDQVPPIYSAIKIGGKRAYELARAGKVFELESRKVEIKALEVMDFQYPVLKIKVDCSSGTYIRTLAKEIGESLGTGAYLTDLERTKIGTFSLTDSRNVEEVVAEIGQ